MEASGQLHALVALAQEGMPVPNEKETGWAPELVLAVLENRKFLALLGFEPRTIQPPANCYTDHTTPVHKRLSILRYDMWFSR
jgi:hypothetical protein